MADAKPKRFGAAFWSIGLLAIAVVGIVFYIKFHEVDLDKTEKVRQVTGDGKAILGVGNTVEHKLAPEYADENNDLIADTPTDPAKQKDPEILSFSYVATDDSETYKARWKDFTDYLSKVTGKPVQYLPFKYTGEEIRALKEGKLQVAGFNTGAVPTAVNTAGFVPAFTMGPVEKGTYCEIIVPSDSSISKLEDLKGATVTFVDFNSNTGYKVPVAMLKSKGMMPLDDYNPVLSYGHEASIRGIAGHQYDAAAVASDMLERAMAAAPPLIKASDFHVIYKSEVFPTAAMGFAHDLTPALQAKIRDAFKTYPWSDGPLKQEFAAVGQAQFTPTDYKKDWAGIRAIDNNSGTAGYKR